MNPLFETETIYTFENYRALCKTTGTKMSKYHTYRVVITICFFLIALLWLWQGETTVFLIFLIAGLLFPAFYTFNQNRIIKKAWDTNQAMQGLKTHFSFYEDYLEQKNSVGTSKFQYDQIYKVIEGKAYFFLYLSNVQGLLIEKKNCSDELQNFIRELSSKSSKKR